MPDSKVHDDAVESTLQALIDDAFRRGGEDPEAYRKERARRREESARKQAEAARYRGKNRAIAREKDRAALDEALSKLSPQAGTSYFAEDTDLSTSAMRSGSNGAQITAIEPRTRRGRKPRQKTDHRGRFEQRLKDAGQLDARPVPVRYSPMLAARLILADSSGRRARMELAKLPPAVSRQVRKAACGRREGHGKPTPRIELAHAHARATVAFFILAYRLGITSHRRGFARVCRGIGRGLFCAALTNPQTGAPYSIGALYGTHLAPGGAKGRWEDGTVGIAVALAACGAFMVQQPRSDAVGPEELGPSGWAFNQYWFPTLEARLCALAAGDAGDRELAAEIIQLRETRAPPD